jgi:CDP-glycerol glycerophosphotransferase (TagB/SpsB family)
MALFNIRWVSVKRWLLGGLRTGLARLLDPLTPIRRDRITFATRYNVPFAGNLRIVADALAADGRFDIAVYREQPLPAETAAALSAAGITVLHGFSLTVLRRVLSSGTVVLSHSGRDAYLTRRRHGRRVVNLWHGVALKRIEFLMRGSASGTENRHRARQMRRNADLYDAMISSGEVDRLVMAASFRVPFESIAPIGLPRFDYLRPDHPLPADLRREETDLLAAMSGRPLVLYAPTFRAGGPSVLADLDGEVLARLAAFAKAEGVVFGIRPHPYEAALLDGRQVFGDGVLDLGPRRFQEPNVILRHASALVVDYSSIWVDFLLKKRTIIGFAPDIATYREADRGFIYDQERLFPGPTLATWEAVMAALSRARSDGFEPIDPASHARAMELLLPGTHGDPTGFTERAESVVVPVQRKPSSSFMHTSSSFADKPQGT